MSIRLAILLAVGLLATACGEEAAAPATDGESAGGSEASPDGGSEPSAGGGSSESAGTVVKVQHVLVGFGRAAGYRGRRIPPRALKRRQEKAESLAQEIFSRAKGGADFTELVRIYSDDQIAPGTTTPGVYTLVEGRPAGQGESPRSGMVKGFGDMAFGLEVGDVGLVPYAEGDSPFGFHIIKRLE